MKREGHIDPDIFDIFIKERVYMRYAKNFLQDNQIDEINLTSLPGFERVTSATIEIEEIELEKEVAD